MPHYSQNSTPPPASSMAERCIEGVIKGLTWLHVMLARHLTATFSWLWRVQGSMQIKYRFMLGTLLMASGSILIALMLPIRIPAEEGIFAALSKAWPSLYLRWNGWVIDNPEFVRYLDTAGKLSSGTALAFLALLSALIAIVAAIMALCRKSISLWMLKISWAINTIVLFAFANWTIAVPKVITAADSRMFDAYACKELWTYTIFITPIALIVPILVLVALLTIEARRYYCGDNVPITSFVTNPLLQNLKTGGADPRFRSSCYWAVALFVLILIGPFLIFGCGSEDYGMPKGSGEPEVQQVVHIKKKPKKKKKLLVDPWSPYILERIDIDDAKVLDELQEQTQDTYSADRTKKGKLGKGGPGNGGWPKGMEGAKVRFIRLKYSGGNWDQEMGKSGDYNLLIRFNQLTGLPIASETEAREIDRLARFPKKRAPPFVFITGSGGLRISNSEARILRNYCEVEGGMLFIDCGGGHFGRSVRQMLAKVFPGKSLVDIPNDDPIYQQPFLFPDGAPRFWHHDGNRALAIRHEGRIVAFYHPGDIKDAWKDGHSGVDPVVADQAYKLGVNVIYYAFNQYYRRHYDQDDEK